MGCEMPTFRLFPFLSRVRTLSVPVSPWAVDHLIRVPFFSAALVSFFKTMCFFAGTHAIGPVGVLNAWVGIASKILNVKIKRNIINGVLR